MLSVSPVVNIDRGSIVSVYLESDQIVVAGENGHEFYKGAAADIDKLTLNTTDSLAKVFTVDMKTGGAFNFTQGLHIQAAGGTGLTNIVKLVGTSGDDTFVLEGTKTILNGLSVTTVNMTSMTLDGGEGNDTYVMKGQMLNTTIFDASGTNHLDFSEYESDFTHGVTVNLGTNSPQTVFADHSFTLTLATELHNLTGSRYSDILYGNNISNVIHGGGGDDVIHGGSGANMIYGDSGVNTLYGGTGNDWLFGGTGNDWLISGSGNNVLLGGDGNDILDSSDSSGRNLLIGGDGGDRLTSGDGENIMISGSAFEDLSPAESLNALKGVFAAWISSESRTQRIANIRAGVTASGASGGDYKLDETTVTIDDKENEIFNQKGTNWLFVSDIDDINAPEKDEIDVLTPEGAPAAPTNFRSTAAAEDSITLAWNIVNSATGYEIRYREAGETSWEVPVSVSGISKTVSGLAAGTEYEFQVRAINANGESAWSPTTPLSVTTEDVVPQYSIVVTTLDDIVDEDDGVISLREAIASAGTDGLPMIITFDPSLHGQTITLSDGELYIDKNITIDAAGANITIDADGESRVFHIAEDAEVALIGLTITNGYVDGSDNSGGGIYNEGMLTVMDCVITGNTAVGEGGGIYNAWEKSLTIINSAIIENTAGYGGGIENYGEMEVINCTVAGNTGDGIENSNGTLTLYNTIIAENTGTDINDYAGTVQGSNNLTTFDDWTGESENNILVDSGQPLFEDAANGDYRLASGSQAIDGGDNSFVPSGLERDLAGNSRISNGIVDIGAYEWSLFEITATANSFTFSWSWDELADFTGFTPEQLADGDYITYEVKYRVSGTAAWETWDEADFTHELTESTGTMIITGLAADTVYDFQFTLASESVSRTLEEIGRTAL